MIGALRVRQNRVVPTPVSGAKLPVANSIRPDRSAIKPAAMEARGIRLQRERGISRQPIAQGMPECSVCTCMLVCAFLRKHCTRDRGCSKHPAFPSPSVLRDKVHANLGRYAPREGEVMSANVDANEFVMTGKEPRQREAACCGSGFVLRNVF